ncbi:MAG: hypothetical protein ACQEQM_07355 [Thermoplasmatota archaeon]
MNPHDLNVIDKIFKELKEIENRGAVVFNANFTKIAKTNLLLLKGLMEIEGEKGLFVSLDRPHQYMSYLLKIHDVDQDDLWFIDAVTRMSGEKKNTEGNVDFLEDAFHVGDLFHYLKEHNGEFLRIDDIDFIVIDNIATMLNYNRTAKVKEFIIKFKEFTDKHPHVLAGVTIDPESNPELSEIINELFDYKIDIKTIQEEVSR